MNRHMLENSSANPSSDEKRFMLMWNMFLVLEPIFSDMQVPAACKRFAYLHAKALSAAPMRQNFVLHLVNMCTFKLLTPDEVQQCLTTVDKHGTKDMSNPK